MNRKVKNAKDFGRVAVLYGGWAPEREVSLVSGAAVLQSLLKQGVDATGVDLSRERLLKLEAEGFDRAFNVLHGIGGEDGVVQAALELMGIPYTGSGVLASALSMDKRVTKLVWAAQGIPTPLHRVLTDGTDFAQLAEEIGLPLFVKPADAGSSIGLTKVKRAEDIEPAYRHARQYCRTVLAERFVAGGEYTCAVLDGQALPLIRIEPDGEFYDYNAKYVSDNTRYHCPAGLAPEQEEQLRALALKAFQLTGASGWGRVDFLLDAEDKPWFLELNTVPGMTSHSLVPMAARAAGLSFDELVWRVLESSLPGNGT
ncbi:MAG TPA: D-alanine--D-alanine ligase [Nevskiales bacterium]|nr:D-alanine--D-alanine ligase [Nevskiales bacterium]